jgi:hypothetical protein
VGSGGGDEAEDGTLVALGELSDLAELLPEAALLGGRLDLRPLFGRRFEADQFVGGAAEDLGQGDEGLDGGVLGHGLVIRDRPLGEVDGLSEVDLGQTAGLAKRREAPAELGGWLDFLGHGGEECRPPFSGDAWLLNMMLVYRRTWREV